MQENRNQTDAAAPFMLALVAALIGVLILFFIGFAVGKGSAEAGPTVILHSDGTWEVGKK